MSSVDVFNEPVSYPTASQLALFVADGVAQPPRFSSARLVDSFEKDTWAVVLNMWPETLNSLKKIELDLRTDIGQSSLALPVLLQSKSLQRIYLKGPKHPALHSSLDDCLETQQRPFLLVVDNILLAHAFQLPQCRHLVLRNIKRLPTISVPLLAGVTLPTPPSSPLRSLFVDSDSSASFVTRVASSQVRFDNVAYLQFHFVYEKGDAWASFFKAFPNLTLVTVHFPGKLHTFQFTQLLMDFVALERGFGRLLIQRFHEQLSVLASNRPRQVSLEWRIWEDVDVSADAVDPHHLITAMEHLQDLDCIALSFRGMFHAEYQFVRSIYARALARGRNRRARVDRLSPFRNLDSQRHCHVAYFAFADPRDGPPSRHTHEMYCPWVPWDDLGQNHEWKDMVLDVSSFYLNSVCLFRKDYIS